jgi:activator of HSP90 ATPase
MADQIHQEERFAANPTAVYEALLDSASFASMTGAPATIDPAEGGAFSVFGGAIAGRNIDCVPGERVVQAWRVAGWDDGVYSLVSFAFAPDGDGTLVVLEHAGYPEGTGEHLAAGWTSNYWQPLHGLLDPI